MQSNRDSIARKRRNDRSLIANAVETLLRRAANKSVRNMCDGDRLVQQRLSARQPHGEVRAVLLHLREEMIPAIAHARKIPLLDHPAEVRNAALNRLNPAIASGIQHQLR